MAGTDYVHSTNQITYELPASPAEKALTDSMQLSAINGPVNLAWNQSPEVTDRYIWPDA
ncbi:hypothetical protein [Arthrobacter sp. B1805]|uniref:hypothetical protein n=1 Tax=Arthrobacter sp. B1805 TaxID=2058892 RepID=UPI0015E3186D|nr:hypothetical protein [Arthrobacter sp. B1805]